jgi:hypothetical protein
MEDPTLDSQTFQPDNPMEDTLPNPDEYSFIKTPSTGSNPLHRFYNLQINFDNQTQSIPLAMKNPKYSQKPDCNACDPELEFMIETYDGFCGLKNCLIKFFEANPAASLAQTLPDLEKKFLEGSGIEIVIPKTGILNICIDHSIACSLKVNIYDSIVRLSDVRDYYNV